MGSGRMHRGPSDQGAGRFRPLDRAAEGSRVVLVFIDSCNCLDYGWILTGCDGGRPMAQKYGALDLDQRRSDHRVMWSYQVALRTFFSLLMSPGPRMWIGLAMRCGEPRLADWLVYGAPMGPWSRRLLLWIRRLTRSPNQLIFDQFWSDLTRVWPNWVFFLHSSISESI